VLGLQIAYFSVLFRVSNVVGIGSALNSRVTKVRVRVRVSVSFRLDVLGLYDLLKCVCGVGKCVCVCEQYLSNEITK